MTTQPFAFPVHTPESAPEGAREVLTRWREAFGYVPAPAARLAESPALLEGFVQLSSIFDRSSLGPLEREVVIMTVARENGCGYCVAMHTRLLGASAAGAATVEALRSGGRLPDGKLEALSAFTREIVRTRGRASAVSLAAFREAGFGAREALDVVLGVGAYTLSTYANRLTEAPLDEALEPFRWAEALT